MATSIVTGGAGFLGSHLVDALAKRGEAIVVIDNLTTGRLGNLADGISSGRVTFIYSDVAVDAATLRNVLSRAEVSTVDAIYHFASPARENAHGPHLWETLSVNAIGTMSLIEIALERKARFVFSSGGEIYDDALAHPQREECFGSLAPNGSHAYHCEAKWFGEVVVGAAVRSRGLDARIVRFFNCYGPRMQSADGQLIPALLEAVRDRRLLPIHGTGSQTRSMIYVDDAIDLLLRVVTTPQESLTPVNIGNDDELSVLDIAKTLAAVLSIDFAPDFLPGREGDVQRRRPDLARARSLGWSPRTSLQKGLSRTHDWFAKESQIFV